LAYIYIYIYMQAGLLINTSIFCSGRRVHDSGHDCGDVPD
jgi:hypothetical protein